MIDGHHSGECRPAAVRGLAHVVATARAFAEALGSLAPGELPDAGALGAAGRAWMRSGTGSRPVGSRCWGCGTPGWRGPPTAPSPVPGGWRHAPNRPGARWRQSPRGAWPAGDAGHRARRSSPVTSASRRCGSSSTSPRHLPDAYTEARSGPGRAGPDRAASTRSPSCWPAGAPSSTPPAKKQRAARDYAERSLHISPTFGGAWRTDGNLTAEVGEIFRTAIDRRARDLYRAEKAAADATGDTVTSTPAERRHDALLELLLQPPPPATPATTSTFPPSPPSSTSPPSPTPHPPTSSAKPKQAPPSPPPPHCAGAATPPSPASSPHPPPPPSTSATPPGSPTPPNAAPSPHGTAAAPSPAATDHPAGPAPTTSSTGSTADPPASGTKPSSAPSTTTASTKAATDSNASPTANSNAPDPTAPPSPSPSTAGTTPPDRGPGRAPGQRASGAGAGRRSTASHVPSPTGARRR